MMLKRVRMLLIIGLLAGMTGVTLGQPYGEPDAGEPGDRMIQEYLQRCTDELHAGFASDLASLETWQQRREAYQREYFHMLGLWPLPEKTPLEATVTGTLQGDGFVVDMLHYQSRPRLYVTANLYRPSDVPAGKRLPAVLYVCGHSGRGRNGNKTAFQSHGMWFARHGYICLMVDSLQLGEIAAIHHGTYREQRWWWHARGYTPAGVECWNGVRGIDYLLSRDDVDHERMAVTGISGGGAATFWVAAADPRVTVAVPVSGMADLPSYVSNRVINGHCDCMFLYNTYRWPWTRIAALVAPRPMLFVNSDQDRIFPMDANERVINQLERLYSLFGAGDAVDAVVSIGGHDYRQDIRQAALRFINTHLEDDPRAVTDSEIDLVVDGPPARQSHPIDPAKLRVFPQDSDLPADELNTTIDQHFVPLAEVSLPSEGEFDRWKAGLLRQLREVTFGSLPDRIPPAKLIEKTGEVERIETEPGIQIELRPDSQVNAASRLLLVVAHPDSGGAVPQWLQRLRRANDVVCFCDVRGVGATRWTMKNPPNYVERCHVLLGRTVDTGRVRDVVAAARYLHERHDGKLPVHVVGEGRFGLIGAYAALLEPDIAGVALDRPALTHMDARSPQLLNVLRVCDVPEVLGALAPRPLTITNARGEGSSTIRKLYELVGVADKLTVE